MAETDDSARRRGRPALLPVTGAWRVGDPLGHRQLLEIPASRPFVTEGGAVLHGGISVAFETWGTLNSDQSNAVLVCHALTGDSHAAGPSGGGHPTSGWWNDMIGAGKVLDPDQWFVVCVNVLGGCQGTTGPAHPHPDDGRPWGSRFPVVSIRDSVRLQAMVADHLGIRQFAAAIGGSMGGMQVLEWGVMFPERVRAVVPIAACAAASAQQIGWWSTGRRIITMDPAWHNGDYYDLADGEGPHDGLALARMVSQITFRSDNVFTERFGREVVEPLYGGFDLFQRFEVERYLEYHGDKLVRRFDANSYIHLTKAMDLHDLGRGRGGIAMAMARYRGIVVGMGVTSDILYPSYQSREIVALAQESAAEATYIDIDSEHGHDAFLMEFDQVGAALRPLLEKLSTNA